MAAHHGEPTFPLSLLVEIDDGSCDLRSELQRIVDDTLWRRVRREPSGNPFNSLVQLEYENGIPRNPFINAGALVVIDALVSVLSEAKLSFLEFARSLTGNPAIEPLDLPLHAFRRFLHFGAGDGQRVSGWHPIE